MINTKIVCGFPGTGKSYYINRGEGSDYMPQGFALDSDSSKFDKSDFPQNYIKHIKENIGKSAIIFVSSHKDVREALKKENIEFILAYPNMSLKEEYIKRYVDRGSSDSFINLISENWQNWILECFNETDCTHLVLNREEFLYNKI